MTRVLRLVLLALLAALATTWDVAGQTASARAYLTPGPTVQAGRPFVVNLEIEGAQQLDASPAPPELDRFAQYLGSGTSTSMQMVNGRTTVSLTVQFRYQALREGTFEIPPLAVSVGGEHLTTDGLTVTVSAAGAPDPDSPSADAGGAEVARTDLFVTATPSKTRVLDGEPLVLEYRIWTRVDVTSYSLTSVPDPDGFWAEELDEDRAPEVEQVVRDGQAYATAVIRRVAMIPTGAGPRTIEPLGIEAQVRQQRRSRDPFDRFFGGGSLFGTRVPTTVLSNPVTIEVDPLPPGSPRPFSGVVGSLALTAELDRDTIAANDAVTLRVTLSGSGNIRAIPEPVLDLPDDFEVFPPEVSGSTRPSAGGLSGTRTFEYVMIPRAPGARSIPPITMGYFDLESGAYRTVRSPELPLVVTGVVAEGLGGVARGGVRELRQDIRFIRLGGGSLRRSRGGVLSGPGFWFMLLLPMAGVAAAVALRRHRDRLEGDLAYARGRRASRVARKRLSRARTLVDAEDPRPFYAEVARALRGLVADRLNVAEAGLQTAEIGKAVAGNGVRPATGAELIDCLEHCDRQRFAPPTRSSTQRARFLERVASLMSALDREIGR